MSEGFAQPIPFQSPDFSFPAVVFTSAGVVLLWGAWGRDRLHVFGLSDLVALLPIGAKFQKLLEFLVFVTIGCVVAIGVTHPINPTQAISAGFGWTAAFATKGPRGKRGQK